MARHIPVFWFKRRWEILERDNFTCCYCGQYAPNVMLEVDHIQPACEGGSDDPSNLITACTACNRGKEYASRAKHGKPTRNHTPDRLQQVIDYLTEHGEASPTQIAKGTGIARPNVYMYLRHDSFAKIKGKLFSQGQVYYRLQTKAPLS